MGDYQIRERNLLPLFKEYADDAQVILSELHDYHTNSKMAQHGIVELTSYITNL